jgi:hypothetical protein
MDIKLREGGDEVYLDEIVGNENPQEGLFFNTMAARLIAKINAKVRNDKKFIPSRRVSVGEICRISGIGRIRLYGLLRYQSKITLNETDRLLYALNLTVLDLLTTEELAEQYVRVHNSGALEAANLRFDIRKIGRPKGS